MAWFELGGDQGGGWGGWARGQAGAGLSPTCSARIGANMQFYKQTPNSICKSLI